MANVLAVTDSRVMLSLFSIALRDHYTVVGQKYNDELDLNNKVAVILDYGLDWESKVKKCAARHKPVLLVSADYNREIIIAAIEIGISDYLTKPFHPPQLVEKMERIIANNH